MRIIFPHQGRISAIIEDEERADIAEKNGNKRKKKRKEKKRKK
jgi:hypothetical protein